MTLRVVTPATTWPVSLPEAKKRLGILHNDDDVAVQGLIATATVAVEAATQRRFTRQTMEWVCSCWPSWQFRLPVAGEGIEVEAVTCIDRAGVEAALPEASYVVSPAGHTVSLRPRSGTSWPALARDAAEAVVVRFVIGPAGQSPSAPPEVKTAILFMVEYLNDPGAPGWKLAPSGLPDSVELLVASCRWE